MTDNIFINQSKLITFVLVDDLGAEVVGLGTGFTLQISKNGGAFGASAGTKAEIGSGWYKYTLTAAETNTLGPLSIKITHASIAQKNIDYEVVGAEWAEISPAVSLADLKVYLGITVITEDDLLTELLARSDKAVQSYTGRIFSWTGDSITRYFSVGIDTCGRKLFLDEDLCFIQDVYNNVDNGSGGIVLNPTEFITYPRNKTPYYAIELLGSSNKSWDYTSDPEGGIIVVGKWSYSETPPYDIIQAIIRLAGYYYKLKDSQVFDVTALPEEGVMMIPKGIPQDVKMLLDPYVKVRL